MIFALHAQIYWLKFVKSSLTDLLCFMTESSVEIGLTWREDQEESHEGSLRAWRY